jgi:hypothetical protein
VSDQPSPTPRPANPARRFVWAGAWLLVALLSGAVLLIEFDRIVGFELKGQRSEGLLITLPFAAITIAVLLIISAIRAIGPWRAYRASVASVGPRESNLRPGGIVPFMTAGIVLAVLFVAGVVYIAVSFTRLANTAGLLIAVVLVSLIAMGSIQLLDVAIRAHRAHRAASLGR